MIYSMTGYGKGKAVTKDGKVECDIKSVNHRFSEVNLRIPKEYISFESILRERISQTIKRGRVDCFLTIDLPAALTIDIKLDQQMAKKYLATFKKLKRASGLDGDVSLQYLASMPGVVNAIEGRGTKSELEKLLIQAVEKALKRLLIMRKAEGKALKSDIAKRCKTVSKITSKLEKSVPEIQKALKKKVTSKASDLAGEVGVDPARVAQEVAFLLMKMDVSEELTRLKGHIKQINQVLAKGGQVGRKLDFLLQESNREITTCGNKIQGMKVSALVVEIKAELEKIREQVQNVE